MLIDICGVKWQCEKVHWCCNTQEHVSDPNLTHFQQCSHSQCFSEVESTAFRGGGGGGGREGKSLLYAHAYIKNHEFGWGVIVMTSRASVMTYPIYYKILPTLLLDFSISASEAQNRWLILSVASRSPPY